MATSTTTLSFLTTPSPKFQAFPPPLFTWQPSQRSLQVSCSLPSNVNNLRVVFAGGGTGSHVYPAVAIAEELKMVNPTCELVFIGSPNSMESAAITSEGYNFVSVPSLTLAHPSLFFPYRFVKSLIQCSRYLRDFQPHLVVGTGGYVSLPVCLAAKLKGITFVIHEPNSVPGLANSLLSFFADVIFVAFNSTVDSFPRNKCVVCGNPVRLSIRNPVSKLTARSHFFPTSDFEGGNKVLLVLGGSFGANAVNIAMLNLYYQMLRQDKSLYIIWQTGVESYDEMDSLVKNHPRLVLMPFMHRMDLAYAAADLIVSRAGAMTCYEILATGKPSILIPSPNFSEGNQFRNASLMADLAGDKKKMEDMSERALKAANPNATAEIAKHIFSLVNLRRKKEKIATNQDLRLMVLK